MTTPEFRRAYSIAGRTAEFRSPLPVAGSVIAGVVVWWPAPPAATDLSPSDWQRYRACRDDFHKYMKDETGIPVVSGEEAQIQ